MGLANNIFWHEGSVTRQDRERILGHKIISFAESLGGVESLITYPWTQTHLDLPIQTRERLGSTIVYLDYQ
ncbi:hypothetical protein JCM17380_30680 [Desulfosporosinus burensis]